MTSNRTYLFQELRWLHDEAEKKGEPLRLLQEPSRSFASRFLTETDHTNGQTQAYLRFFGLLGSHGSLPDYFTDEVLHAKSERNGLQDFVEMFNHRTLENFYRVWRKFQVLMESTIRPGKKENDDFDAFLAAIGGQTQGRESDDLMLLCLKRHHLSLFQKRDKTFLGLQNILASFFQAFQFTFEPHVEDWIPIPSDQKATLKTGLSIGQNGNFLVGTQIRDLSGKFRIVIRDLDYEGYQDFLPGGQRFNHLKVLLGMYTQNQWKVGLVLELRAEHVPQTQFGQGRLGASCWALTGRAKEDARIDLGNVI